LRLIQEYIWGVSSLDVATGNCLLALLEQFGEWLKCSA